ncbi:MAG TPA: hypothetical protein VK574_00130 [Terracidiphilus sp.]|jgi:hypothetical protein|nr:hypothetical protein [Terracidiphilus sp.]
MIIVTTIYCAESEPAKQTTTGKVTEMTVADLKDADRKLMSVYQGTNRVQPLDGER